MSEATVQDSPATETAETETETEASKPEFDKSTLDEFGLMAVERATANTNLLNAKLTELAGLSSDPAEVQKSIYSQLVEGTLPDGVEIDPKLWEQYLKAREFVGKATAHFDTVADSTAKARVAANTDTAKVAEIEAEVESLGKRVRETRKMIAIEWPGAETLLPNIVRSKSGGSTGSGRGAGGKKMRGFTVSVDGTVATLPNSEGKQTSSFAAGAKVLGIPTADLQRAYFAAIDATPENYQDKVAELTGPTELTVNDSANAEHKVVIERNAD